MKKKLFLKILALLVAIPFLGCSNIFQGVANKTSDEALFDDVQTLMDKQEWDEAITKLEAMSTDYKARPDVIESWAGIYAGKCGLNFIDYFQALGDANLGGTTIFGYFMAAWSGETVNPSYCTLAQAKMEEISALPSGRTSGQNLFMAVLGMVKIGVYLKENFPADGVAASVCTSTPSSDAVIKEVVTGMGLITTNITYLTAVLSNSSLTGSLDTVNTVCSSFPGACGKTDPDDVTTGDLDAFRDLLKTDRTNPTAPLGIGNCVDPTVVPCC
jgi:hypothetical protein